MKHIQAVLHAHSTWSYDGQWDLHRIARLYGALGVDAVMMTEHDTGFDPTDFDAYSAECAAASTRRCTLIPGIEYSSPDNDIHILTWGLQEFLVEHRPVIETLRDVKDQGGVAVFAHPIRRDAWRKFDPDWVPYLSAIELWNRKSDGITWGPNAWDLIHQTGLPATVGQDFHCLRQLYPLTQRFEVENGVDLDAALVANIAAGRWRPQVFFRDILRADATPKHFPHSQFETMRRGILKLKVTGCDNID